MEQTPDDTPARHGLPVTIATYLKLTRVLGAGSFGSVCEAVDTRTGVAAVKLEPVDAEAPQVAYEYMVLRELSPAHGFPRVLWFGTSNKFHVLVMERLGETVEAVMRRQPRGRIESWTILTNIARQALARLDTLHGLGFVYRDLKPQNLLFGMNDTASTLYLIDLGLAKRVIHPDTKAHIPRRLERGLTGTSRYASLHAHELHTQSFRDDIESLGYLMMHLALGTLPWLGMTEEAILDMKRTLNFTKACEGLPPGVLGTIQYGRDLPFGTKPDFAYLIETLWRHHPTS